MVTAETSVVTVLPRDKIFGSTGAQLVVSMMEGIRLLDIGALTIDDVIIAYREKVIRTNKAPDKDRFRRDLRKLLRNRYSSTSELASEKLTPGKAMGVEIERTENGPLETSLGQPALPTSDLSGLISHLKKNNPPLSFEVLSDLEIEKLEEIAEVGIPENARHVYYWDEDERIGILSVDDAKVIASGFFQESGIFQLFYASCGRVYRLFSRFELAIENYVKGDVGVYVKDYGEHLFLEEPGPHREYEASSLEEANDDSDKKVDAAGAQPDAPSEPAISSKVSAARELCFTCSEVDVWGERLPLLRR